MQEKHAAESLAFLAAQQPQFEQASLPVGRGHHRYVPRLSPLSISVAFVMYHCFMPLKSPIFFVNRLTKNDRRRSDGRPLSLLQMI
jgi:hypothetical protein